MTSSTDNIQAAERRHTTSETKPEHGLSVVRRMKARL